MCPNGSVISRKGCLSIWLSYIKPLHENLCQRFFFVLHVIFRHWNDICSWIFFPVKVRIVLLCKVIAVVADDLVKQGASAVTVLI